jgi:hypothetical protein
MQSVTVKVKSVYGNVTAYPACPAAALFAQLLGTKTLTPQALKTIQALGFEVKQQAADLITLE